MFSVSEVQSGGVSGRNSEQIEHRLTGQVFCWLAAVGTGFQFVMSEGISPIYSHLDVSSSPMRGGIPMTRGASVPFGLPLPRKAVGPSRLTGVEVPFQVQATRMDRRLVSHAS